MKSRYLRSGMLVSGMVVLALVLGVAATPVWAQDGGDDPAAPVLGAINIITADVFVTPADGGDEIRLFENGVLNPGETLRTDASGTALVTWFYDGTEVALGPQSRLTLNSFSGDAGDDFALDVELHEGHLVGGVGSVAAAASDAGEWTIKTPTFTVRPLRGQFELSVSPEGDTRLIVTDGRVEVLDGDAAALPVDANQYLVGAPGVAETISTDGVTPTDALVDAGICTATAPVNLNIRLAPNEDSRRLGGIAEGQTLWVRAATEGDLWLQVYYETAPEDEEAANFGWVYGPAVTLDDAACGAILRAPLDAMIYGGLGVDEALGTNAESDPIATDGDAASE